MITNKGEGDSQPRGYENAPATRMLASHCAACGRPLVDAASIEAGMGPDCRERLFSGVEVEERVREEANKLIYRIALDQKGKSIVGSLNRLRELGFVSLVDRVQKRCAAVVIEQHGELYRVKTPYKQEAVARWRSIPGRKWYADDEEKYNIIPVAQKAKLWDFLVEHYSGHLAMGPKGAFVIE